MRILSRAAWGARPPKRRHSIATPTPKLYLHHAAGAILPADDSVSPEDLTRIRSIQNYHMDTRGWSDIAYSFLMDPDGNIFEGRGAGVAGGHTAGQNTVSHAICIMGHYDLQAVDSDLLPRLAEFVRYGHGEGWWPLGFTGGHRDAPGASTSCPGHNLYTRLPKINALVQEDDMPLTEAEMNEIAKRAAAAVMAYPLQDPISGNPSWAGGLIRAIRVNAHAAASQTTKAKIAEAVAAAGVSGASADAIVDEIARRLDG